ncbi:hypothetical protein FALCPG4_015445 [Fusarium falciforme]
MARKHIQALERERNQLERENLELEGSLRRLEGSASDGKVSSSGQETPFDFNINTIRRKPTTIEIKFDNQRALEKKKEEEDSTR